MLAFPHEGTAGLPIEVIEVYVVSVPVMLGLCVMGICHAVPQRVFVSRECSGMSQRFDSDT